jgi:hypothetical protein
MRVGIIQSNYLPWRGYFDFIDDVDLFVIHDDVQFTKSDWRNRNRIKTANGPRWLTVPVHYQRTAQLICATEIDYSQNWSRDHHNQIATHLANAPYVRDVVALLDPALTARPRTISDLNVALLRQICAYLGISTPLISSRELGVTGAATDRVIALLNAVGATTYLSGPSARAYLDESAFQRAGIRLEYKRYRYPPYPQLWGPFDGALSVVDVIANCGPRSRDVLKSEADHELAVA